MAMTCIREGHNLSVIMLPVIAVRLLFTALGSRDAIPSQRAIILYPVACSDADTVVYRSCHLNVRVSILGRW